MDWLEVARFFQECINERRKYEWRVNFSVWAALGLFIYGCFKGEVLSLSSTTRGVAWVGIAVVLGCHGYFLDRAAKANKTDQNEKVRALTRLDGKRRHKVTLRSRRLWMVPSIVVTALMLSFAVVLIYRAPATSGSEGVGGVRVTGEAGEIRVSGHGVGDAFRGMQQLATISADGSRLSGAPSREVTQALPVQEDGKFWQAAPLEVANILGAFMVGLMVSWLKFSWDRLAARETYLRKSYADFGASVENAVLGAGLVVSGGSKSPPEELRAIVSKVRADRFSVLSLERNKQFRQAVEEIVNGVLALTMSENLKRKRQAAAQRQAEDAVGEAPEIVARLNQLVVDLSRRRKWHR